MNKNTEKNGNDNLGRGMNIRPSRHGCFGQAVESIDSNDMNVVTGEQEGDKKRNVGQGGKILSDNNRFTHLQIKKYCVVESSNQSHP